MHLNTAHSNMKDLTGSLQYVVSDIMDLAPEELPAEDSLVCYHTDLEQLLDPKLLITHAYWICKAKGQVFCEHVFGAWTSAMRNLPSSACCPSLLHRCLALLTSLEDVDDIMWATDPDVFAREAANYEDRLQDFQDQHWPGDPFEDFLHRTFASMMIEVVRQKFDARTIEEAFRLDGNVEKLNGDLWKLVNGHPCMRGSACTHGGLRFGLGAELMMALIEKGLPKWCWGLLGPYNDNLLQYIIEPIAAQQMGFNWNDEEEAKGRLFIFLAQRFSLEEFCRENEKGENVLDHSCYLRDCQRGAHGKIWIRVCHVIAQRMVPCVREFQGSLLKLIDLADSVHWGLRGNLSLHRFLFFFGKSSQD